MKKSLIASFIAVSLLVGCSSAPAEDKKDDGDTTEVSETSEEEAASEEMSASSEESLIDDVTPAGEVSMAYDDLISEVVMARNGELNDDELMQLGEKVSYDIIYAPADLPVYVATLDIDADGVDELFFYVHQTAEDGSEIPVIFDGYTYRDDDYVHFLSGGSRDSYYLASDGSIYNIASSGAAYTGFARFNYSDGALTLDECYYSDDISGEVLWYHSTTALWGNDGEVSSAEEASAFMGFDYMFIANEIEI